MIHEQRGEVAARRSVCTCSRGRQREQWEYREGWAAYWNYDRYEVRGRVRIYRLGDDQVSYIHESWVLREDES